MDGSIISCSIPSLYTKVWQTFSAKGQTVNILGFAFHMVLTSTTKLCFFTAKAITDNTQMNKHGYNQKEKEKREGGGRSKSMHYLNK